MLIGILICKHIVDVGNNGLLSHLEYVKLTTM